MKKFLAVLAVSLAACTAAPTPHTVAESIAFAETSVTTAQKTLAQMVTSGRVSPDRAEQLNAQARDITVDLKLARAASQAGDVSTAEGKLAAATALLTQLQTILKESQK